MRSSTSSVVSLLAALSARPAGALVPPVEVRTLPNGLEVLVVENHAAPLVTIEIGVRAGAMVEDRRWSGLSHLTEHMFFRPNRAFPSGQALGSRKRALGIVDNGRTTSERISYYLSTTSGHLEGALGFMRDAVLEPLYDPAEIEAERRVVLEELDGNAEDPGIQLTRQINERVWWKYPTRKVPFDNRPSLRAATLDALRDLRSRYYLPNNSVLVIAGDVRTEDVFRQVERLFGRWKAGPDPFQSYPMIEHPPIPRTEVVVVPEPVRWVTGVLTWQGPSIRRGSDELTHAALLLGASLRDPFSRFQRTLVDSGTCMSAELRWTPQRNVGPIAVQFEASGARVDDCLRAVLQEIPTIGSPGYLNAPDLGRATRRFEVDSALQRERPSELAHELTGWWAMSGLEYYRTLVPALKRTSPTDIARLLESYVLGKPYVLGVMLSPDLVKAGLDRSHFEAAVTRKGP
jgi:zinc protease